MKHLNICLLFKGLISSLYSWWDHTHLLTVCYSLPRKEVTAGQHMICPLSKHVIKALAFYSKPVDSSPLSGKKKTKPFVNKSICAHSHSPVPSSSSGVCGTWLLFRPVSQTLTSVCILGYNLVWRKQKIRSNTPVVFGESGWSIRDLYKNKDSSLCHYQVNSVADQPPR